MSKLIPVLVFLAALTYFSSAFALSMTLYKVDEGSWTVVTKETGGRCQGRDADSQTRG